MVHPTTHALTALVAFISSSSPLNACKTKSSVALVIQDLKDAYQKHKGHAAATIRLVFHDAGTYDASLADLGGPTGCLADSHENAGLDRITNMLEPILTTYKDMCNTADLWALAGLVSIDLLLPSNATLQASGAYQWGRVSEDTCAYKADRLPGHQLNCADSFAVMRTPGFTSREVTALLGAHSVGTAHAKNSGFLHSWDNTPGILDNHYYATLMDDEWGRVRAVTDIDAKGPNGSGSDQKNGDRFWIRFNDDGAEEVIMLNADMCLGFEIGNNDKDTLQTAELTCQVNWEPQDVDHKDFVAVVTPTSADTCPRQAKDDYRKTVLEYKQNEEVFLDDFLAAFTKLISLGYANGKSDKRLYALCEVCEDDATDCCCGLDCVKTVPTPAPTEAKVDVPENPELYDIPEPLKIDSEGTSVNEGTSVIASVHRSLTLAVFFSAMMIF